MTDANSRAVVNVEIEGINVPDEDPELTNFEVELEHLIGEEIQENSSADWLMVDEHALTITVAVRP